MNTSILFIESTSQGRKKITHLTDSYSLNEKLQSFIIFQLEGTTAEVLTKPARQDLHGRTQDMISTKQKKGKHQTNSECWPSETKKRSVKVRKGSFP